MENKRNYYRILQVQPDAPAAIIKASYHTLMHKLKMHPDLGGDHWNASLLNEAMAVLGHPEKRAAYDRKLFGTRGVEDVASGCSGRSGAGASPGTESTDSEESDAGATAPEREQGRAAGGCACPFCGTQHISGSQAVCTGCGSPLTPVATGSRAVSGKRFLERVSHDIPVIYYTAFPLSEPMSGRVRDFSLAGMRFGASRPLRIGQCLRLDCAVAKGIAQVVRCQKGRMANSPWEIGVAFLTLEVQGQRGSILSVSA